MSKPSTARPAKSVPPAPISKPKAVPTSAPKKLYGKYSGPPALRVRAIKTAHNEYTIVEEKFEMAPTSTRVLAERVDGSSAMYRCRLRLEELLGPNRLGGTGLE